MSELGPSCSRCGAPRGNSLRGGVCAACRLEAILPPEGAFASSATEHALTADVGLIQHFGPYELLEEVGRGGMGVIYKARQPGLDRVVALKMLLAGEFADAKARERLLREAKIAARLTHPHIVTIHEVGEHQGRPYFAMEYVPGRNLSQHCRDGLLPVNTAVRYVEQLARAVHYAHQHGVIHRDLKPANILISPDDEPKLTDFGLTKSLVDPTQTIESAGSPNFMAPEQADSTLGTTGTPTDIFGLGAILYYLLTGRPPAVGETLSETLRAVVSGEPVAPRQLRPALPRDLETITLKCLEKEQPRRYGSAQEVADELARWQRHEPIHARPATGPERLTKWVRRHPVVAGLTAAVVLSLLGGIGATSWQARRANRATAEARAIAMEARRHAYASDMNLAQRSLELNNLGQARRLLDRHRPQAGKEDLRGWEWRYLWQLSRNRSLTTLTNRPARGFSLSFSPNGALLVAGWTDGRVELWNAIDRRLVKVLSEPQQPFFARGVFSPTQNLLAATARYDSVVLHNFEADREIPVWEAHGSGFGVRDLAFSPDGTRLVLYAGTYEGFRDEVVIANVAQATVEHRFTNGSNSHRHSGAARLSPDNQRLYLSRSAFPDYRYAIQCLEVSSGREIWHGEWLRDSGLTTLAVSPDGRWLASGSGFEDTSVHIWDAATGRQTVRLEGHTAFVTKVEFTPDGRHLLTASTDQTIRIWNTATWESERLLRGHRDEVFGLAFSPVTGRIATGGKDGDLLLWPWADGEVPAEYQRYPVNQGGLNAVFPLDRGNVLLARGNDDMAVGDGRRGIPTRPLPDLGSTNNLLAHGKSGWICRWDGHNQIVVEEWHDGRFVRLGVIATAATNRPVAVTFEPSSRRIAWSEPGQSNAIFLADLAFPDRRQTLPSSLLNSIPHRFSEDGRYLATRGPSGKGFQIWQMAPPFAVLEATASCRDLVFAMKGHVAVVLAITGGEDHELRFYDLEHPSSPPRIVQGKQVPAWLEVSPDGRIIASSGQSGTVKLCDAASGTLMADLHGPLNGCFGLAFSDDGQRLLVAGTGREAVNLWDMQSFQKLLTLPGVGSQLDRIWWSEGGESIICGPPWQSWTAPSFEEILRQEADGSGLR